MSQEDIYDLLLCIGKPLSREQIAKKLNMNPITVNKRLRTLIDANEICIIELDHIKAKRLFNVNRRMRLYYAPETHD